LKSSTLNGAKDLINDSELSSNSDDADDESEDLAIISELTNMDKDVKRWEKSILNAYQCQAGVFARMRNEILDLKLRLNAKNSIIDELKIRNDILSKKNMLLRMELSSSNNKASLSQIEFNLTLDESLKDNSNDHQIEEDDDKLVQLLADLKRITKSNKEE
jgi:hypothetical protein